MAVLPPNTCTALPSFLHPLMLEETSPISDYFPSSFEVDLVGKKFAWLGEVLLPFIDEHRLLSAMEGYQSKLNEDESTRNKLGIDSVYVARNGPMGKLLYNQ
jgi:5'-3' exoribonuclease 2